jgi:hypothetical protein
LPRLHSQQFATFRPIAFDVRQTFDEFARTIRRLHVEKVWKRFAPLSFQVAQLTFARLFDVSARKNFAADYIVNILPGDFAMIQKSAHRFLPSPSALATNPLRLDGVMPNSACNDRHTRSACLYFVHDGFQITPPVRVVNNVPRSFMSASDSFIVTQLRTYISNASKSSSVNTRHADNCTHIDTHFADWNSSNSIGAGGANIFAGFGSSSLIGRLPGLP